jgi:hypothetical protein
MRNGSHCLTITGSAGCVTAMPMPITAVAANKSIVVDANPRSMLPMPAINRSISNARRAPSQPIRTEPVTVGRAKICHIFQASVWSLHAVIR